MVHAWFEIVLDKGGDAMGEFDLGKSVKEQTGTGTLTSGNVFLFPKISLLILKNNKKKFWFPTKIYYFFTNIILRYTGSSC